MSEAAEAFDAQAVQYDRWYETAKGKALFASEIGAIRMLMPQLAHPFLEIGVGTGRFAEELGVEVGIDPSEQALVLAQARRISVYRAKGEDIPFADESFGAVFVLFTLCFVQVPEKVLLEARRVLQPEGRIIVGILNRESAWGALYMSKKAEGHPIYRHARFYSAGELTAMLAKTGFQTEAFASTLFQSPSGNPCSEQAQSGLSPGAGFLCFRAKKVSGGAND